MVIRTARIVPVRRHLCVAVHYHVDVWCSPAVPTREIGGELCDSFGVGLLQAAVGSSVDIVVVRGADTIASNGNAAVDTGGVGVWWECQQGGLSG